MLIIRDVSAGYHGRTIIQSLSLNPIASGSIVALVGPNAAGKSTFLRGLAGLIPATGSVELDGVNLVGLSSGQRSRYMAYMPQSLPQRVSLSALESVVSAAGASAVAGQVLSDQAILECAVATLTIVGIESIAMSPLDQLSGGQRQLVSLAQVLVREPRVLLLDEPISALDLRYQLSVMKVVRDLARTRGAIVIVVLHDLAIAARWSDHVVVLSRGAVVASGAPQEAITPAILGEVYGVRARVTQDEVNGLQIFVEDTM